MGTQQPNFLEQFLAQPTPDDVVGAVFAFSGVDRIPSDRRKLQGFFYDLSRDERYASMLEDFEFTSGRDLFPFSRVLEASLGRLQMGKIIYARNPDFDTYGMDSQSRDDMVAIAEQVFNDGEQTLLREAAQRFEEETSASESKPVVQGT